VNGFDKSSTCRGIISTPRDFGGNHILNPVTGGVNIEFGINSQTSSSSPFI